MKGKKLKKLPEDLLRFFRAAGKKGGKLGGSKGGTATAAKMTPQERTERARKAARARWGKPKAKKKAGKGAK